ncbi:MAG: hypothetical protein SFV15_24740 [Polyangiaceae bacterium]|nr:hypothetical protein [Polyangiaceae bacterium]
MIRWVGVTLVVLLTALVLYKVREHEGDTELVDEILAYELVPGRALEVPLYSDMTEVNFTSWMLLPDSYSRDPSQRFEYGVQLSLIDAAGHMLSQQVIRLVSRVSGDPAEPAELGRFSARLVDGSERVTDSRTKVVDTSALNGRGRLRLTTVPGEPDTVLVRLAYPEERSELMQRIAARTLALGKRRRLVEQSFSLGFSDLPEEARLRAVTAWGRRLTAAGRADTDYVTRRLLLGSLRSDTAPYQAEQVGVPLGPLHNATFNLKHSVTLRIEAEPGRQFSVREGDAKPREVLVGDSGRVELKASGEVPRTLNIESKSNLNAQFSLPASDSSALIGDLEPMLKGGRLWLSPDVRNARFYRLDPAEPVQFSIAPLQAVLRLVVRGLVFDSTAPKPVWVRVLWDGQAPDQVPELQAELPVSPTDDADGSHVTAEKKVLLRLPAHVRKVRVVGDGSTVVAAFSEEPGVAESRIHPAYDVPLAANQVWRAAPYDIRRFAGLRPSNEEALVGAARVARVGSQVRIESLAEGVGERIAERVLIPLAAPMVRSLYTPTWAARGRPSMEAIWSVQQGEPTSEQVYWVPQSGERAARMPLIYRADPRSLGGTLRVTSAQKSIAERPLLALDGELTLRGLPASLPLGVSGLGAGGILLIGAAPDAGGKVIVRSQKVFELTSQRPLLFSFQVKEGELLSAWLNLTSLNKRQSYRVKYAIDRGKPRPAPQRFFRRMSQWEGELLGSTGSKLGLIWEAPREGEVNALFLDHIGLARIELGDDLAPGVHTLELRLIGPEPLWVRAVLAGRVAAPSEDLPALAEEE